jgi:hypothetical protein
VNQTLQLLLAALTGAALVAGGLAGGMVVVGRPSRAAERRLDRAMATSEARQDHYLNLLIARTPEQLGWLTGTSPAPAPAADSTLAGPAPATPPWADVETQYTPDPNELGEGWDLTDDAAFRSLRG